MSRTHSAVNSRLITIEKLGVIVNHLWNHTYSILCFQVLYSNNQLCLWFPWRALYSQLSRTKWNCQANSTVILSRGGGFNSHISILGFLENTSVTHKVSLHIISDKRKYLLCSSCTCSQTEKNWSRVTDRHPKIASASQIPWIFTKQTKIHSKHSHTI